MSIGGDGEGITEREGWGFWEAGVDGLMLVESEALVQAYPSLRGTCRYLVRGASVSEVIFPLRSERSFSDRRGSRLGLAERYAGLAEYSPWRGRFNLWRG